MPCMRPTFTNHPVLCADPFPDRNTSRQCLRTILPIQPIHPRVRPWSLRCGIPPAKRSMTVSDPSPTQRPISYLFASPLIVPTLLTTSWTRYVVLTTEV